MSSYGTNSGNNPPEQPPQQPQMPPQMPPQQGYPAQQGYPPQQSYPPQMGAANIAPPRRRSPLLIIGIIVIVLLVLCGVGFFALFAVINTATQPVVDAGDAYMTALRDGNYTQAFNLSAPALQQQVTDAAGLQTALSSKQPTSWSWNSKSVNNDQGALSGTTSYKDGTTGTVDVALSKIGNDWKVTGISLK